MLVREQALSGVEGVRWIPEEHDGVGALVLAGSSGRVDTDRARVLAGAGVLSESIRWFAGKGQHAGPWEIPLELFCDRVSALRQECDRVLVVGTSFGAEAALLTGVHSRLVDAVVAFAPSDVVWAGVTSEGRVTSHWRYGASALSFVPFDPDWHPETDPPAFLDLYRRSRERFADAVPAASIAVEAIAHVVLVAGGDDQVWPSVASSERIRERRSLHGLPTTVVVDEQAGHRTVLPGEPVVQGGQRMARGGTAFADQRLGRAAWDQIVPLLEM
jgi:hypothetical protein